VSVSKQKALVWWSITWVIVYGLIMIFLFHVVPPPAPSLTAQQIAHWYVVHHTSIRIGAMIAGWTSAWAIPLSVVIGVQIERQEEGRKVWAVLAICGGVTMSIFIMFPFLCWGVAAFTTNRDPQVTDMMFQLGTLSFITTDQFYVFLWVAVAVICLTPCALKHTPFPRWFGYYSAWEVIMYCAGAVAFFPRHGPFAWNGLLAFWFPLVLFGTWLAMMCFLLLRALNQQRGEELERSPAAAAPSATQRQPSAPLATA
jgi:hypothetical protein